MKTPKQLTRQEFRDICLKRDNFSCVICKEKAVFDSKEQVLNLSVHHLIERRLWGESQGYFECNGATLCDPCHYKAEETTLSCDELREICKIDIIHLPDQFYKDDKIDKWGNYLLPSGDRLRGELFYDESVQKVLKSVFHLFTNHVKYPRTFHVPWSPGGKDKNERVMASMDHFKNIEVIVTTKMDGENSSLYNNFLHARTLSMMDSHPSRSRIKALWSSIKQDIPEEWRLCIENLQAKHSIHYKNLCDFALLISIWNEKNVCLSWDETQEWAEMLELKTVPVIYRGIYDEKVIKMLWKPMRDGDNCEGYVIRPASSFSYGEFRKYVCKYVREGFLAGSHDNDWKTGNITENQKLK